MMRKTPSPATVISIIALVFAVAGTAVASVATISVLNKKEKKQTRNIARDEISKEAPGLSVASGKSAGSAANADKLDGHDASDFTAANRVHDSGRVVLDDPTPGDNLPIESQLFTAGAFTVKATCEENYNFSSDERATLQVQGPPASSFSGHTTTLGDFDFPGFPSSNPVVFTVPVQSTGDLLRSAHVVAVAPSGDVISVSGSFEVHPTGGGDCVVGATAIGP